MAGADREPSVALRHDLLREGPRYDFYQAVRIARLLCGRPVEEGDGSRERIARLRIRPDLSLRFPPSDVVKVEEIDGEEPGFRFTVSFLGLYGASSPLPTFYTEDLFAEASEDSSACRDFLDIVNQRLYELLFACWAKYRAFLNVVEEGRPEDLERLFCLVGLGEPEQREGLPEPEALLRYAGLFTQHPRSALGLATLLRDALGDVPVEVVPCVRRTVTIPADQRFSLGGSACRLGVDARIGLELEDRTGKFRLRLGPVSLERYDALLPGRPLHRKAVRLVRFYLNDPLEYDMELALADGEAATVCLGGDRLSTLGWDTWIFSGGRIGEVRAVFPPLYS